MDEIYIYLIHVSVLVCSLKVLQWNSVLESLTGIPRKKLRRKKIKKKIKKKGQEKKKEGFGNKF